MCWRNKISTNILVILFIPFSSTCVHPQVVWRSQCYSAFFFSYLCCVHCYLCLWIVYTRLWRCHYIVQNVSSTSEDHGVVIQPTSRRLGGTCIVYAWLMPRSRYENNNLQQLLMRNSLDEIVVGA